MATLKKIAEITGVSARTVSRALNGTGYISPQLKEKILAVADEVGYVPNRAAQSLRLQKNREIVLLFSHLDELSAGKIVAFEKTVRAQGYTVQMISLADEISEQRMSEQLGIIRRIAPAGVITLGISDQWQSNRGRLVCALADSGIYVMMIDPTPRLDSTLAHEHIDRILINRQQGVYEAVVALYTAGHRSVAYVGPAGEHNWTRLEGYRRAVKEFGLQTQEWIGSDMLNTFEDGVQAAAWLAEIRPSAVQCFSDVMAMGVLQGLLELGLRVPQDISVIGFDNREFAAYATPKLTTIAQPNQELGLAAAQLFLNRMDDGGEKDIEISKKSVQEISPQLVRRDSALL